MDGGGWQMEVAFVARFKTKIKSVKKNILKPRFKFIRFAS
jgi:hypothetical protein